MCPYRLCFNMQENSSYSSVPVLFWIIRSVKRWKEESRMNCETHPPLNLFHLSVAMNCSLNFRVGSSHVITESSELSNALGEISWLLKLVCALTLIYWSHHFQLTHLTTVNLQRIKSDIRTPRFQTDRRLDSERRRTIKERRRRANLVDLLSTG